MGDQYVAKLPNRWLQYQWVERFSTIQQGDNGAPTLTASPINNPDLFLWIKNVHHPQLTAKQFRDALRNLCRDKRPGYKESPLPKVLRQLLNKQMKEYGKNPWGHQQIMEASPVVDVPVATAKEPIHNYIFSTAHHQQTVPCAMPDFAYTIAYSIAAAGKKLTVFEPSGKFPSQSSSMPTASPIPSLNFDYDNTGHSSEEPAPKRSALESTIDHTRSVATNNPRSYAAISIEGQPIDAHAFVNSDSNVVWLPREPSDNDENDVEEGFDDNITFPASDKSFQFNDKAADQVTLAPAAAPGESEGLIEAFNELAHNLHDFGLVSKADYHVMEQHFTSCFSGPIGFSVYSTNRHLEWRPNSHVNQEWSDIVGVDMMRTEHVVCDRSSIEYARDLVAAGNAGEIVLISDMHINCLDKFGTPIRKRADMWVPVMKFNQDETLALMALHDTVTLLRQPGLYPPEA